MLRKRLHCPGPICTARGPVARSVPALDPILRKRFALPGPVARSVPGFTEGYANVFVGTCGALGNWNGCPSAQESGLPQAPHPETPRGAVGDDDYQNPAHAEHRREAGEDSEEHPQQDALGDEKEAGQ
jgi:hypothetical protein